MAGISERAYAAINAWRNPRAWKVGPKVVSEFGMGHGHDDTEYSPVEYGNYLVTSNPIYTCATIRADALGSLDFKAYQLDEQGRKVEDKNSQVLQLLRKVNDFWTMSRLLVMTELSLCVWGRCYWAVERGPSTLGKPQEIWWMKPSEVDVVPHPVKYVDHFEYSAGDGEKPILFMPHEVVWFRYPNPLDEFSALSPLAAARLGAEVGSAAGQSNRKLFEQGFQLGGYVAPEEGRTWTIEQAHELEQDLSRRFKGVDKAHRWAVLRMKAEMKSLGVTPKDAEFLGALAWSLEEACRAYKIPLDMVGGQRTYENVRASDRAFWMRAMLPESKFISSEVVEQFLPMFTQRPDVVELDVSHVPALQEEEGEQWKREEGQIKVGAITVNEWRATKGLEPVEWGDDRWSQVSAFTTESTENSEGNSQDGQDSADEQDEEGEDGEERLLRAGSASSSRNDMRGRRAVEYGSEEHRRLWGRYARQTERFEREFKKITVSLFERQRESVLQRLQARAVRTAEDAAEDPFDMDEWIKKFKQAVKAILREIVAEFGMDAAGEIGSSFDVLQKEVIQFLEQRGQRFAEQVNETTWQQLKDDLNEGLANGESVDQLAGRVEQVMDGRIESSAETIARTEVIGASNGGTLEAWKQSGLVAGKVWLAALDDRTRDSHVEAHGQEVGLEEDFVVGGARGPAPGQMGEAEEDINCRCTMTAVLK